MKQTKSAKFRELYPKIEKLLEVYTYEGTIEILKNDYGLDLSKKTFRLYLYRARKLNSNNLNTPIPSEEISHKKENYEPKIEKQKSIEISEKISENSESSFQDDDEIDPEILAQLKADLDKQKNTLASPKTIF